MDAADPISYGDPISYEVLATGTAVYSSDGEQIGVVTHVLAVPEEDVFDGIVIAEHHSSTGKHEHGHRFVDADDVAAIHERAVSLKLDTAACAQLPTPSANPAAIRVDYTQAPPSHLHSKLRRAWDLISGNY
jgi:hypothetical protein